MDSPKSTVIRATREAHHLTQSEAAHLIGASLRAWQQWEAGQRRMHSGLWELFNIKIREVRS